jgi:hypothetical protein
MTSIKILEVKYPDCSDFNFKLDNSVGRSVWENFIYDFMPQHFNHKTRLVKALGHHFSEPKN